MKYVLSLLIALTLNAAANLLMKVGMKDVQASGGLLQKGIFGAVATVIGNTTLLVGLTCFGLNAAFYMYALQSKTLTISLAYPIMVGGGFALIATIAHFHPALAETLTWPQKFGVGLVLVGVLLIASQGMTSQTASM
jgi:small multidrug resistance pump